MTRHEPIRVMVVDDFVVIRGMISRWIDALILWFGINIMPAAYPPDVAVRATSLEGELGRAVDCGLLLSECLASLSRRTPICSAGGSVMWRTRGASAPRQRSGAAFVGMWVVSSSTASPRISTTPAHSS